VTGIGKVSGRWTVDDIDRRPMWHAAELRERERERERERDEKDVMICLG
jgi:hypothetical protein